MMGARSPSVATGWWDTSVAGTSGARENSPGLKADGLGCVGGPVQSRWEGNAPTDYSRRGALPETARRNDHSVAPGATDFIRSRVLCVKPAMTPVPSAPGLAILTLHARPCAVLASQVGCVVTTSQRRTSPPHNYACNAPSFHA